MTSAERQKDFSKQARRGTFWAAHRSSMKVSKAADFMPVTPSEPISSLSASIHTAVYSGPDSWRMADRQA